MHSFGYRPGEGEVVIDFQLQNASVESSIFRQSTPTSKLTKWYDVKNTFSNLFTTLQYGLDDKTRIGLKLENVVSSNSKNSYSTEAKAAGNNDESSSSKGSKEPAVFIEGTFKETNDLRVNAFLSYSPKMDKSSDSNVLSGGSEGKLSFELIKAFEKTEFVFGANYTAKGIRYYEEGSSRSETRDGNMFGLNIGLNFRTSKDSSIVITVNREMYDFSTTKYEANSNPTEVDSYSGTFYIVGYQFSMAEDLLFQVGYVGYSSEEVVARSGTQTIIVDPYTGGGVSFGMKVGF